MSKQTQIVCDECGYTADLNDILGNESKNIKKKEMIVMTFKEGTIHRCPNCNSRMRFKNKS